MAGALAQILQRAKLAKQAAQRATTVVTTSPVLRPTSPQIMETSTDAPMLNANRPVDTLPAAPTINAPAASVPALESVHQTLSSVKTDWRKYLPWLLVVIAVLFLLFATRKSKSA